MVLSLTGILGFLIFLGMIGIAVLVFIIALLIKFIGKKHFAFLKLSMVSIVFFIIGLVGVYAAETTNSSEFNHALDDYLGWLSVLVALVISVFILLKKNSNSKI